MNSEPGGGRLGYTEEVVYGPRGEVLATRGPFHPRKGDEMGVTRRLNLNRLLTSLLGKNVQVIHRCPKVMSMAVTGKLDRLESGDYMVRTKGVCVATFDARHIRRISDETIYI
jgi:hypothetical protein